LTTITRAHLATLTSDEAAALWVVQQDSGVPVEAGLFEEWLGESDENQVAWHAVQTMWSLFDDLDDPAFTALREHALADIPTSRTMDLLYKWRGIAVAAALLAIMAGGFQWYRGTLDPAGPLVAMKDAYPAHRIYTASADAAMKLVLADGTLMTLDKGARVMVAMTAGRRQLALERGGAEFTVNHDPNRPFTVAARNRTIVDIGTHYKVVLETGGLRVALYEGGVRIDNVGGKGTLLRPGEQLVAREGKRDVVVPATANEHAGGDFVQFDNVTLAAAAETINQGSPTKLVISDPTIARLRVSGRFRTRDAERFARSVSELLSLRIVRVAPSTLNVRRRR
jgi:transmembrane sensor